MRDPTVTDDDIRAAIGAAVLLLHFCYTAVVLLLRFFRTLITLITVITPQTVLRSHMIAWPHGLIVNDSDKTMSIGKTTAINNTVD
jgi:hypothetical protein